MINKIKLKEYMQYIIKTYPKGCASYNWLNDYSEILNNTREIEKWEIDNIIEESLSEFACDLGLCGCGSPEDTNEVIRLILIAQNQETWEDKQKSLNNVCNINVDENYNYNGLIQFVLYILDSHEFLEHGGSIGGAWLTEKGKIFLDLLNCEKESIEEEDE